MHALAKDAESTLALAQRILLRSGIWVSVRVNRDELAPPLQKSFSFGQAQSRKSDEHWKPSWKVKKDRSLEKPSSRLGRDHSLLVLLHRLLVRHSTASIKLSRDRNEDSAVRRSKRLHAMLGHVARAKAELENATRGIKPQFGAELDAAHRESQTSCPHVSVGDQ